MYRHSPDVQLADTTIECVPSDTTATCPGPCVIVAGVVAAAPASM